MRSIYIDQLVAAGGSVYPPIRDEGAKKKKRIPQSEYTSN
jgi:hypothetical protein